jgi:hypothetical protein
MATRRCCLRLTLAMGVREFVLRAQQQLYILKHVSALVY